MFLSSCWSSSSTSLLWIRPVQGAFTTTTTTSTTNISPRISSSSSNGSSPSSRGTILFQNSKYSPLASPYRSSSSNRYYYSREMNLPQLLAVPPPSSQEPSFLKSSKNNNENIHHHHHRDKQDNDVLSLVDSTTATTAMNVQDKKNKKISWTKKSIRTAWSQSQKSAMTFLAAALIMASVLLTPFQDAIAAPSGGRMGGSFGGGSGSNNRQSYSSGRSSTYRSPSSSSYTRGFTQGYGTGYLSRPSVTVVPSIGGYGYGYGGYFGAPIVSPGLTVVSRGPSIVDVLIFGFFATFLFRTFTSSSVMMDDDDDNTTLTRMSSSSLLGSGVTVAQISVAVRVPNRKDPSNILSFLERLSRTARTDSRVGISNLVSQVALELLRQKRFIFAADTEYKHFSRGNENGAQRHFSSKTIQERSKFEKENTSKYGGVDYSSSSFDDDDDAFGKSSSFVLEDGTSGSILPRATNAVVTLIISIDGDSTKLPQINNVSDLEKALTRIATDVKVDDCLRSAEVLWTPDDKRDVLSDRDIYVDYPKLRNV
jgi:Predicted membrane protein